MSHKGVIATLEASSVWPTFVEARPRQSTRLDSTQFNSIQLHFDLTVTTHARANARTHSHTHTPIPKQKRRKIFL